ncbi:MAG: hypothetical protein U0470_04075 [Anaerolineae bacterium]
MEVLYDGDTPDARNAVEVIDDVSICVAEGRRARPASTRSRPRSASPRRPPDPS